MFTLLSVIITIRLTLVDKLLRLRMNPATASSGMRGGVHMGLLSGNAPQENPLHPLPQSPAALTINTGEQSWIATCSQAIHLGNTGCLWRTDALQCGVLSYQEAA